MTVERRRNEYLSPNFVLAIVLALATAQQTWNNFNIGTTSKLEVLEERMKTLRTDLDTIRRELREDALREARSERH